MPYKPLRLARILRLVAPVCVALPLLAATAADAQTYTLTTLATFNGTGNGANPIGGLTLDSSGNLYGTTPNGGASGAGTVFEIAAGTNTLTTLATFSGTANGGVPFGAVTLDSSGDLYGTTRQGGANNDGTVFKLSLNASAAPEPGALALLLPAGSMAFAASLCRKRKPRLKM